VELYLLNLPSPRHWTLTCLANAAPPDSPQVLKAFPGFAAFEEWAVEEGWAQLVLPSTEEAEEYFVNFRLNKAVAHTSAVEDENIVQGMVDELHMVMKSVRFSVATLVKPPLPPPLVMKYVCFLIATLVCCPPPPLFYTEEENIVHGMVDNLHIVMKSVQFSVATLVRPPPPPPTPPYPTLS